MINPIIHKWRPLFDACHLHILHRFRPQGWQEDPLHVRRERRRAARGILTWQVCQSDYKDFPGTPVNSLEDVTLQKTHWKMLPSSRFQDLSQILPVNSLEDPAR